MDRLPPEILCNILEYSTWGHTDPNTPYSRCPTLANLKVLRLCCRSFAELGAKYLFEQLWVHMNEGSFAKMTAVAEHPAYSHMVHELKIFPKLLTRFYDNGSYEREVRRRLNRIEANGVKTSFTLSANEIAKAYERYNDIWRGEDDLSGRVQTGLLHAMNQFIKLHSITSGIWQDFVQSESRRLPRPGKDSLLETTLKLPGLSWVRFHYRNQDLHTPAVSKSMMRAIALSLPVLSGILRRAEIFVSFTINYNRLSARDTKLVKRLVNRLTHFELPIPNNYLRNSADAVTARGVLNWCSPNLQELSLVDSTIDPYPAGLLYIPDLFELALGDTHWPRLSSLSLKGFEVDGNTLITLLLRHRSTLKKLYLSNMRLQSGSWRKVFTELRGGAVTFVGCQKLYVGERSPMSSFCATNQDVSWDIVQKNLQSFIVEGQPWPSNVMPASLSQDNDDQTDDSD